MMSRFLSGAFCAQCGDVLHVRFDVPVRVVLFAQFSDAQPVSRLKSCRLRCRPTTGPIELPILATGRWQFLIIRPDGGPPPSGSVRLICRS